MGRATIQLVEKRTGRILGFSKKKEHYTFYKDQPLLEKQDLVEGEGSTEPYTSEMIGTIIFMVSYILTVMIVLVNVAVAVLLEGFLSSIAEHDVQKRVNASVICVCVCALARGCGVCACAGARQGGASVRAATYQRFKGIAVVGDGDKALNA